MVNIDLSEKSLELVFPPNSVMIFQKKKKK